MPDEKELIQQQIEYYRARAAEYDQWFNRLGRYDRGEEQKKQWFTDVESVRQALKDANPSGDILELACGTGLWTKYLISNANKLTAVDVSPEMIEINRHRLNDNCIEYIEADLFKWQPSSRYDFIFFGFWLSHVPASHFDSFWKMIDTALNTDGHVFFIDNLLTQDSTARDHAMLERKGTAKRKLNDGREFEIVKHFYDPVALEQRLHKMNWTGFVKFTEKFFLYGCLTK